jgi:hypothetical protein
LLNDTIATGMTTLPGFGVKVLKRENT